MQADELKDSPCGRLVPTIEGQLAFVPAPLPRHVDLSPPLISLLDRASRAVATLSGVGEGLPNPHLLIRPFLRREAVLSSRIEGTQASLSDLFMHEAEATRQRDGEVLEVVNYIQALELGLDLLEKLPLSVRFVNQVHARLMEHVRGDDKRPGELRAGQVWIGSLGTSIGEARFIPPPHTFVRDLLTEWEDFVNADLDMPPLIQCALMHYQFETIHPYADGNGRVGRLLIILFLCNREVLSTPLLYLSAYFERHRQAYYDHLYNVSVTGDWEPWLRFFLEGVAEQAHDALIRSRRVRALQDEYRQLLQARRESANAFGLLDGLFINPFVTAPRAARLLGVTPAGARRILDRLTEAGIVEYVSGVWPRLYVARQLLEAIEAPIPDAGR